MHQPYETLIFRAQSEDGLFDYLMQDPALSQYLQGLGEEGWVVQSSTSHQVVGGHWVMLTWMQRPRQPNMAPPTTALPVGMPVEVQFTWPGYI